MKCFWVSIYVLGGIVGISDRVLGESVEMAWTKTLYATGGWAGGGEITSKFCGLLSILL